MRTIDLFVIFINLNNEFRRKQETIPVLCVPNTAGARVCVTYRGKFAPTPRGQNDRQLWKHYLLATSLTVGKNFGMCIDTWSFWYCLFFSVSFSDTSLYFLLVPSSSALRAAQHQINIIQYGKMLTNNLEVLRNLSSGTLNWFGYVCTKSNNITKYW